MLLVCLLCCQIAELQNEVLTLRASHAAATNAPSSTAATGAAAAAAFGSAEQQLLQQQLMLSLAADNARLAVALAELMQGQDSLQEVLQQQQQLGDSSGSLAALRTEAGTTQAVEVQRQQRLQLLVSQLVMVQEQVAGAAKLSELQRDQLEQRQQQLLQLTADLAELQQQYGQLQREHLQQAKAAVLSAVMAAAEPGSAAVVQVSWTGC